MNMDILLQPWKGLKPQDKVIYIRWLLFANEQGGSQCSIASLAEKLRIKDSTVRSSVARLYSNDKLVSNDEQSSGAIVYPQVTYNTQAQLAAIFQILGVGLVLTSERAEELAKRLLKAVLVSLADDLGIIKSVSYSYLSSITGMTVQRLRRYKNELMDDGFILKFITGGNAPKLYKKSSSICIIDPKIFGGSRIELQGFKAEILLRCQPNQRMTSRLNVTQNKFGFLVSEINQHRLADRLYHFFDELVSQSIRKKLTPGLQSRSREIISMTDSESVNKALSEIWTRDIDIFSDFFLYIVLLQIEKNKSKGSFDIYFIRTENSCYLLSNIGGSYTGDIKVIDSDSVVFRPDSNEQPWEI